MTPTQQRISDTLAKCWPLWLSGYELRDAIAPQTSVANIKVQIFNMRRKGVPVESRRGAGVGGYRFMGGPA